MGTDSPAKQHDQPKPIRARFWLQLALAAIFTVLFVVTMFEPTWIETLFDAEPDAGDGSAEWLIVAVFGAAALVMYGFAGREWRRRILAPQGS